MLLPLHLGVILQFRIELCFQFQLGRGFALPFAVASLVPTFAETTIQHPAGSRGGPAAHVKAQRYFEIIDPIEPLVVWFFLWYVGGCRCGGDGDGCLGRDWQGWWFRCCWRDCCCWLIYGCYFRCCHSGLGLLQHLLRRAENIVIGTSPNLLFLTLLATIVSDIYGL